MPRSVGNMGRTQRKPKSMSEEEIMEEVQRILQERGNKALEMARKEALKEEIECKEVREALNYFMTEYWQDLARPALLSLCCEAVGGDPEATIPVAIPLSLISGGIDIHDDIIDQSRVKRSRPTVLGKFGKDIALLVGDALLFKGFVLLYKGVERGVPAHKIPVIIDIVKRMFFELGDAEALELQFRGRINITPEEYLYVVRKKAADVESYTRIGAIFGDGSKDEVETLSSYGRLLGELLILRDDMIDTADFDELSHRLKKEHLPLPVLYALQVSNFRSGLQHLLLKKELSNRELEEIFDLTYKAKGIRQHGEFMEKLTEKAYEGIEDIRNKQNDLKILVELTRLPYE